MSSTNGLYKKKLIFDKYPVCVNLGLTVIKKKDQDSLIFYAYNQDQKIVKTVYTGVKVNVSNKALIGNWKLIECSPTFFEDEKLDSVYIDKVHSMSVLTESDSKKKSKIGCFDNFIKDSIFKDNITFTKDKLITIDNKTEYNISFGLSNRNIYIIDFPFKDGKFDLILDVYYLSQHKMLLIDDNSNFEAYYFERVK